MDFAFSEALSLLGSPAAPTAFLCLGTRILSGVLQALRHSGRLAPDDVSVISIGDTDLSQLFSPAITSLTWDLEAVGTAVAELLLRRLDRTVPLEQERILLTTQMVLRESCGPVAKAATGVVAARKTTRTAP
jgi:LacI family transcriptional regulator